MTQHQAFQLLLIFQILAPMIGHQKEMRLQVIISQTLA